SAPSPSPSCPRAASRTAGSPRPEESAWRWAGPAGRPRPRCPPRPTPARRVGTDNCVRIGEGFIPVTREHDPSEILEVHLVHDPGIRRYDPESPEGLLG